MKKSAFLIPIVLLIIVVKTFSQEKEVFVQKNLNNLIDFVISKTDTTIYSTEDYVLWKKYLNQPQPTVETVKGYFEDASKRYGVPVELLMVIGQVESNWVQIGPSIDRGWGIMHLVDNEYCKTLHEAARLIHCDMQLLKDNARFNILGAAALIKSYADKTTKKSDNIEDWFEAVKKFSGLYSDELCEMQAKTYYDVLNKGISNPTLWDEVIIIPQKKNEISKKIKKNNKYVFSVQSALSSDYSPAISDLTTCN
jgi:hypothetical protein